MQIELKDLEVGDEILVPSQGSLKYLKILRPIKERKISHHKMLYKNVYCSARKEQITETYILYNGSTHTQTKNVFMCSSDHNVTLYQDLNYKTIWLVKRNII